MANIKFYAGEQVPLEMHKVRIIQRLNLPDVDARLKAITEAGNNTFLLGTEHVFLDMLTDSGVNAMSDRQQAAMMLADDAYAGSQTFTRLSNKVEDIFGTPYFLPAHQGRACENIVARTYVKEGQYVPLNYHFTTTKAHITEMGGKVVELLCKEGLEVESDEPFKGNMDIDALSKFLDEHKGEVSFVRMEAGTNLIGGQPFSLENLEAVRDLCRAHGLMLVLDASLLSDNLYFIKTREESCKYLSIREITRRIADATDILYFSARKLGSARGGGICTREEGPFREMRPLVPLFEGFLTYGGMSVREMEALTVGLEETMDEEMINQGPIYIEYMVDKLKEAGVPVITPGGGLGCHVDAMKFCDHIPQEQYPAGALAAAFYLASGCRGMERGTMSEQRNPDGTEELSNMELLRLALPRRVFTLSQVKYAVDRLVWLYENRHLIGGLRFVEEPEVLRFFYGRLEPISDWQEALVAKFKEDFGDSL
ncbi:MAG TPA: tryptophanase [Corynebacteriales bacterium]|nr:tryptophanase [Mycobacteriales bacterium]